MKTLLHRGYFREVFRQLRVPGIISAAILLIPNASSFLSNVLINSLGEDVQIPGNMLLSLPITIYIYIVGFLLTFLSYNWLNHRSTSDFYHALPITRTQIYASTTLSILIWMFIAITTTSVLQALMYLILDLPFNYLSYLFIYINMLIGSIEIVGAVSLACALSGTRFVNLFAGIFILFIPRFMLMMFGIMIMQLTSVLPLKDLSFLFNASYNYFGMPYGYLIDFFYSNQINIDFSNIGAIIYSFAYACLLVVLGGIAFHNRQSELAGVPIRNKFLQAAVRTAFGLPLLLLVVMILQNSGFNLPLFAFLILFSFAFYCLYELISTKSAKKMVKAMPLYSICIAIALLYLFLPKLVVKIAEAKPSGATDIRGFQIVSSENYSPSYADLLSERVVIDDPEGIELIAKAYDRSKTFEQSNYGYSIKLRIHRNSGLTVTRRLMITEAEYERLNRIAMRNETYYTYRTEFPKGILFCAAEGLSRDEAAEIASIYEAEYNQLDDESKDLMDMLAVMQYFDYGYDGAFRTIYRFTVQGTVGANNYAQTFAVTELTPKSAKRFSEILNQKNEQIYREAIRSLLKQIENGEPAENSWSIGIGSYLNLYGYELYSGNGKSYFTKEEFPECYEIVKILAEAETTNDIRESVTVTLNDLENLTGMFNVDENRLTVCLKLSNEDLDHIRDLLEKINTRIGY